MIQTSCIPKRNEEPAPLLLLGLKNDLRYDAQCVELMKSQFGRGPVSVKSAKALACEIGAKTSLFCSAMTQENVREVFDEAIERGLDHSLLGRRRR